MTHPEGAVAMAAPELAGRAGETRATPPTRASRAEEWIRRDKIIAIVRTADAGRATRACRELVSAGLAVVEITADHPHALASVASLRQQLQARVLLGVGTVLDVATAEAAADAGADFCVAPNLDPDVIRACADRDMLAIPGVFTPTEIVAAQRLGLSLLKLFPCGGLRPEFLSALRGPFRSVGFVPTGGIGHADAGGWLAAGAAAVGLGSSLVGGDISADALKARVRDIRAQVTR
jgi:2-dehydro-3-deoxyphosphogluconate aldolase / (4S)-4-hydroxy-2-oxoglutarate aldolase